MPVIRKEGESKAFPRCGLVGFGSKATAPAGEVPAAHGGRCDCYQPPEAGQKSEEMASGVPLSPPAQDKGTLCSRVLCHLLY